MSNQPAASYPCCCLRDLGCMRPLAKCLKNPEGPLNMKQDLTTSQKRLRYWHRSRRWWTDGQKPHSERRGSEPTPWNFFVTCQAQSQVAVNALQNMLQCPTRHPPQVSKINREWSPHKIYFCLRACGTGHSCSLQYIRLRSTSYENISSMSAIIHVPGDAKQCKGPGHTLDPGGAVF